MNDRLKKTERLIKIWALLHNNPQGYTAREFAGKFKVDIRTVYRDISALENELKVPVYPDGNHWKLDTRLVLPPIRFTVPEALNVVIAARLMLGYNQLCDANMDITLKKLGSVLPWPLGEQVQKTIGWMHHLPASESSLRFICELAGAWIARCRVRMVYHVYGAEQSVEGIVEPYFFEPTDNSCNSYVIAYCHQCGETHKFRIANIESIQVLDEKFTMPLEFDANRYFGAPWGVVVEGEVKTVSLKFDRRVVRLVAETVWHPSQVLNKQKDGSLLMTLQVTDSIDFFHWILWWGDDVEVLEPPEIREAVIATVESTKEIYSKN